jgi:hypothetical protein
MDAAAREYALWDLVGRADIDGFAEMLAPDGVFIDGGTVQTRDELVADLRSVSLLLFELSDVVTRELGGGLEAVVYRVEETLRTATGEVSRAAVASSTWVERDARWLLIMHHESSA